MKQLIFLLCFCVVLITVAESWINDASERVASKFVSSKEDVKNCIFETNITLADLEVMAQIFQGEDTTDKRDSALRIGCLFACVFKKKEWLDGTRIRNVQQLKRELSPENLDPGKHSEILDTCNNRIQNLTNECEVMLNFIKCITSEQIAATKLWLNDASERIGRKFVSSKEDVKNCIFETNITLADLEVMAQIFQGEDTADKKDSALRIGCLFACMFKKKEWLDGTRIRNVQQLKRELSPENLDPGKHFEILDTCNNRIQHLTNECEVMLNFVKCISSEQIAAMKPWLNDASERVASKFMLSEEDVKNCIFQTNITVADLEVMAQIFQGEDTTNKKDSALRIGCLFACVFKKKEWLDGTRIRNVQQLKKELSPENLDLGKHSEILDTCNNRIQHLTNECEVILNLIKCITSEQIAAMKPWLNDASERVASKFSISKPNAKNCFIKTEITAGDLALIRLLLIGETADIEESAFKIGCLYACVFKEKKWLTGTDLNVQKLKRELSPKRSNPKRHDEILDICTNNVKNLPNECKVMTNFIICMSLQQKRSPS